jgi:parvulin-like peptidyl-prolyl isomerase
MLAADYAGIDEREVASTLGTEFAARVFGLDPGAWHGPVASAYGFHLVRVEERVAAQPRAFEEVREDVAEQWRHAERTKADEQLFTALLAKYELDVDADVAPLVAPLVGGAP